MRQVTARYFFRLRYHQGYYQACRDMERALRAARLKPHERLVVHKIREWAEKELTAWDQSEDKKDWRRDEPPRCPIYKILEQVFKIKDPEKHNAVPFLDEGLESTLAFLGNHDEK